MNQLPPSARKLVLAVTTVTCLTAAFVAGNSSDATDMEPRISIVTLGVADLERSIEFYRDGLGLPLANDGQEIAFFTMRGTQLALYPREALAADATVDTMGSGFRGVTLSHNVRDRESVNSLLAEAAEAGARIVKPAAETYWGGYSGYFADPDGHLWEVAWNPDFEID